MLRTFGAILLVAAGSALPGHAGPLLFVGDAASPAQLEIFNGTTGAFVGQNSISGALGFPTGVAIGPNGNVYVADQDNSLVDSFNGVTGAYIGQFIPTGSGAAALFSPSSLLFAPNGDLYVANFGVGNQSYINSYNATTGAFISQLIGPTAVPTGGSGSGLDDPNGMALSPNGTLLYIADSVNGVDVFNLNTLAFSVLVPLGSGPSLPADLSGPSGIAVGPNGDLYVADAANGGVVDVFDPSGNFLGVFGATNSLVQPIDLVFGPDGNLYVTDASGVEEFNGKTGASMGTFIAYNGSDMVNPQYLAFTSPVPEPSTFALAAIGGLIGWRWRRRRAQPQGL
jgi:WD40 repeat protein